MEGPDPSTPATRTVALRFTGSGGEYFRIWIVNLLLTIATLGIYSAWAKVRKLRYLYGNTDLDGHAFEYHGTPRAILRGRMIAAIAIAAYLLAEQFYQPLALALYLAFIAALPWIVLRARQFSLRVTSWRGVHFDFDSRYGQAAGVYLLGPLLIALTLGLMFPWFVRRRFRWLVDHSAFGTTAFRSETTVGPYAKIALKALGIGIAVFVIVMLAAGGVGIGLGIGTVLSPSPQDVEGMGMMVLFAVLAYAAMIAVALAVGAYWRSRTLNYTLTHTTLGPHRLGYALRARRLAFIYLTNLLGVIVTLGLFTPFAVIRVWRYMVESGSITFAGSTDEFVAAQSAVPRATGEELGDLLNVDMGL